MRTRSAVAVTIVVMALGACSSSSAPSSNGSSPSTSAATAPSSGAESSTTSPQRSGGAQWTTYYGDGARDGVSSDGPAASGRFHVAWTSPALDGDVYAQPLVVGTRVFIATEQDTLYALSLTDGHVAWKRHLGTPVPGSELPCGNIDPVGITGTPVVDAAAGRIYAVGLVQPVHHELFALDLGTGRLVASQRADVTGSDPKVENQRGALALANETVYVPYGGRFGDCGDYHGRVQSVAVDSSGLGAQHSYTLPTQREGGFWSPPGPTIASDGSLYLASGNSSSSGTYDYGNTLVHLSPQLQLLDSFAPTNWKALNAGDVDIGSTSPALLAGGDIFQIGKSGTGYLLDAAHLGGVGGELTSRRVCPSEAFGGVAHRDTTVFVPCNDGIVQIVAGHASLSMGWKANVELPGPAVVAGSLVWLVATGTGELVALDAGRGDQVFSTHIGAAPSRFTSPAIGGRRIVVAADRKVFAIAG